MELNNKSNFNVSMSFTRDRNNPTPNDEWIPYVSIPLNAFLMISDIWLLISLIHYGMKTGKFGRRQQSIVERFNSGIIYISLILCSVSSFLTYLLSVTFLNGNFKLSDYACNLVCDVTQGVYSVAVGSSLLFLWFRQRAFYRTKFPGVQFSKIVKFFSKYFIIFIFATLIPLLCIMIYVEDQESSDMGCVHKLDGNLRQQGLIAAAVVVFTLNFSLAFLFIFALKKIAVKPTADMTFTIRTYNEIEKIMKKTIIFAIISFSTNTVNYFLFIYLSRTIPRINYGYLLVTFDATVNLACVLFSFRSWKDMIVSPITSLKRCGVGVRDVESKSDLQKTFS